MYVLLAALICFNLCPDTIFIAFDPPEEPKNTIKKNPSATDNKKNATEESDKTTIRLGGPRKATVEIIKSDTTYRITATFIPVKSFDKAMNTLLSRDKGDAFIREALFKHLGGINGQSITISQLKKLKSEYSENLFTYAVELPFDSVKFQKQEAKSGQTQKKLTVPKSILNAKADQLATLDFILAANEADYPEYKEDLADFYRKAADSENLIIQRFEAFTDGVKSDKWLLSVERDELIKKAEAEMSRTVDRLRILIQKAEMKAAVGSRKPAP